MKQYDCVEFCVYGDYGLFADPIMRVGGEKCSYQVPTYESIKGILSSVYWKPTFTWYIDEVRVMNPIQTEVKGVKTMKYKGEGNDLSYYTYLKNCRYQVRAHFEWNENRPDLECDRNLKKHYSVAQRMIKKGGRRDVFLGTRDCQGYVEPCVFGDGEGYYDNLPHLSFGVMYHGITYADEAYSKDTEGMMTKRMWTASMSNGVIRFPRPEECTINAPIRKMSKKAFNESVNLSGVTSVYEEVE